MAPIFQMTMFAPERQRRRERREKENKVKSETLVRRLAARSAFIAIVIFWLLTPGAHAQVLNVPTVISLSPNTATAGGSGFSITVSGSNFLANSVVRWNGSDRPT